MPSQEERQSLQEVRTLTPVWAFTLTRTCWLHDSPPGLRMSRNADGSVRLDYSDRKSVEISASNLAQVTPM